MKRILFFLLVLVPLKSISQGYSVDLHLSYWTDTTANPEFIPIIKLYKNYLESNPDSVYDNQYWNTKEKAKYEDFDISRNSLFPSSGSLTAKQFFSFYNPHILKIESMDSVYRITAMMYNPEADSIYQPYNPVLIHRYYAILENDTWKLANAYTFDLEHWHQKTIEFITYFFEKEEYFKPNEVQKSIKFCDSISKRFNLSKPEKQIQYYITDGPHNVGKILGYDYYIYGWANGKVIQDKIISGNKSAYYPHEFVHILFPENKRRGLIVNEGLATWLGGSMNNNYAQLRKTYCENYLKAGITSIDEAFEAKLNYYAFGALLIELVYDAKGDEGVLEFINLKTESKEDILLAFKTVTGWSRGTLRKNWKQKIKDYTASK